MATTLREMIYDIKERMAAYSDDNKISDEHIAFLIRQSRAKFLKYYISNLRKEVPFEAKQNICIDLDLDSCEEEYNFLISKQTLPGIIESSGRSLLQDVRLPSKIAKWINIIEYHRIPYIKSGRLNSRQIYITVDPNRRILVYNPIDSHILLDEIKLSILAEDPEEADKLSCDDGDIKCDFYDKKYPVESSLVAQILDEVFQKLTMKFRMPVDILNDAEDNTANAGMQMYGRRPRTSQAQDPTQQSAEQSE